MNTSDKPPVTDITVENSQLIKAIALIFLMWHHLFGVEFSGSWISPLKGLDIIFGVSASICRTTFMVCTGYGLYRSYINKSSVSKIYTLKKIAGTLVPYWIVMIITIICLAVLGKFDPRYLPGNIFCWILDGNMYVSFAWYIKLHMLFLLVLPLIRAIEKKWKKNLFLDLLIYIILPFVIYYVFHKYRNESRFENIFQSLVSSSIFLIYWFPFFGAGLLFAKYEFYSKIRMISGKIPKWLLLFISFLFCTCLLFLRYLFRIDNISEIFYTPLFIISCLLIIDNIKFRSKYIMPYLGDNSIFYWLLSSLFFVNTVELQPLADLPRISILILIWTLILLTPCVYCCNWLSNKILKFIFRNKKADS